MTSENELSRLEEKLDTLIALVAMSVASENHSLVDRAIRLQRAGLTPKLIAALLGTTPNTVSVALSKHKRGSPKTKGTTKRIAR